MLDGGIRIAATSAYPGTTADDWAPHARWLDHDGVIDMPIGCFLVRTADRVLLVDCGLGPYTLEGMQGGRLLAELAAAGVEPAQVTDVVLTHLHFDHVGWATQKGTIVFDRATYRCHRADWDYFVTGEEGLARKMRPVADRLAFWEGATTLAPGVDALPTPGHTPGHTALVVSSGAERAILLGDVVHCPVELEVSEWEGMSDVDPDLARRTRESMARELESSGTPAAGPHLPGLEFGRLIRAEGRLMWSV